MWIWAGFPGWRGREEWFLSLWNLSAAAMLTCSSWGDRPCDLKNLDLVSFSAPGGAINTRQDFQIDFKRQLRHCFLTPVGWVLYTQFIHYIYNIHLNILYIYTFWLCGCHVILGIVKTHELGNPFLASQGQMGRRSGYQTSLRPFSSIPADSFHNLISKELKHVETKQLSSGCCRVLCQWLVPAHSDIGDGTTGALSAKCCCVW